MLILEESLVGIEEFNKRYKDGVLFAFFSASQQNLSYADNVTYSKYVRKKFRECGFDNMIRFYGEYKEPSIYYESNIIFFEPEETETLMTLMFFFGKKFNQNGFIILDKEKYLWTYSTRQNSTYGGYGKRTKLTKFVNHKENLMNLINLHTKMTFDLDKIKIITD